MPTPGGFKDGRLYSLDNLPPLSTNKIWVGNAFGFPEETDIPGAQDMTNVAHNGTVVGSQPFLNFKDGTNVTLTVTNDIDTSSIDVLIAASGGGGGAPSNATYILQTVDSGPLPNSFALGSLTTGLLKNTTTTGVLTIASPTADYLPYNANLSTIGGLGPTVAGTILNWNGTSWSLLNPGTTGQVLTVGGGSGIEWAAGGGGGIHYVDDGNVSLYRFFVGSTAGNVSTSGLSNIAVGIEVLPIVTTGYQNLGYGQNIFNTLLTGFSNVGLGYNIFPNAISANTNTLIGNSVFNMTVNTASSGNVAIGFGVQPSGTTSTLTSCTFVGTSSGGLMNTNLNNSGTFGYNAIVNLPNSIRIGSGVNVGLNQASPAQSLHVSAGNNNLTSAIMIDNTLVANIPAAPGAGTGGILYVTSSSDPTPPFASDKLWFQPGVGSAVQLNGGGSGLPLPTVANQLLLPDPTNPLTAPPVWANRFIDTGPTGLYAFFLGSTAGNTTLSGTSNTGVGIDVLGALTGGTGNGAFGENVLNALTSGNNNVGLTNNNSSNLTIGNNNIIMGLSALNSAVGNSNNIAMGYFALNNLLLGDHNIALGYQSLWNLNLNTGSGTQQNIGIGSGTLAANTGGSFSVGVGYQALLNDNTAGSNTGLGFQAGLTMVGASTTVAGYNTFLGYQADVTSANINNAIAIGAGTKVGTSYCANISGGNPSGINLGINNANPLSVLHLGRGQTVGLVDLRLESSFLIPTQTTTTGSLYLSSTSGTVDKLWFQAGSGSPFQLNSPPGPAGIVYTDTGAVSPFKFFVGSSAGNSASGSTNAAVGLSVLDGMGSGATQNVGYGINVLHGLTTGTQNTAVGYGNGTTQTSGSSNTYIGYLAGSAVPSVNNSGAFGATALVYTDNVINIGNGVNVGINNGSPASTLHVSSNTNNATLQLDLTTVIGTAGSGLNFGVVAAPTGAGITNTTTVLQQKDPGTSSIFLTPMSGSFTVTVTGGFPDFTTIFSYTKIGNLITLIIPELAPTGPFTSSIITVGPTAFLPSLLEVNPSVAVAQPIYTIDGISTTVGIAYLNISNSQELAIGIAFNSSVAIVPFTGGTNAPDVLPFSITYLGIF